VPSKQIFLPCCITLHIHEEEEEEEAEEKRTNKPGVLERSNLVNVERDGISFAILVVGR
jgi:hypothetical protein